MPEQDYRYDVAISLLSQDQEYAGRLEQQIRSLVRGDVLLYSSRQRELAITGELVDTLTRVFRDEARVVVILYRPEWGRTSYTSIEGDAIKSRRARTPSTRFLVVVSMEPPHTPEWYPGDSEFWLDPATFNLDAIAGVIAARVHESGGKVGKEGPVERARRLQSLERIEDGRRKRLEQDGPAIFDAEVAALSSLLSNKAGEIAESADVSTPYMGRGDLCTVSYRWATLVCQWRRPYYRSMRDAGVLISIQDKNPLKGHYSDEFKERVVLKAELTFDLDSGGIFGWKPDERSTGGLEAAFLTTAELVDWALTQLIDHGHGKPPEHDTGFRSYRR